MKFYHWSSEPIDELSQVFHKKPLGLEWKPHGFWFDADGDWKRWCEANEFRINELRYCYEVSFKPEARILHIVGSFELDRFTQEYCRPHPVLNDSNYRENGVIDWPAVAKEYDGIIIAPYIWERRLELMWYYGWDCASGCVWNIKVIEIKPLENHPEVLPDEEEAS